MASLTPAITMGGAGSGSSRNVGVSAMTMAETGTYAWITNFGAGSPGGGFFAFGTFGGSNFNLPQTNTVTGGGFTVSQTYVWGTAACTYTVMADHTLQISGTAHNSTDTGGSPASITNFNLQLMKVALPGNASYAGNPLWPNIRADCDPGYYVTDGSGTVNAAPFTVYYVVSDRGGWPATMNGGPYNNGDNPVVCGGVTLAAGATITWDFRLNFVTTAAEVTAIITSAQQSFLSLHPQQASFPSNLFIGQVFLVTGTGVVGSANNPRGWFGDATLDIRTQAGITAFQNKLLTWADYVLLNLRNMGTTQGAIVWDIEGEQYIQGAVSYIGDPRMIDPTANTLIDPITGATGVNLAPEMSSLYTNGQQIVDVFINKITSAGYKIGFCLRETILLRASPQAEQQNGSPYLQNYFTDAQSAINDLSARINYCQNRWGPSAVLYYIDSNSGSTTMPNNINGPDYVIWQVLQQLHPDCLLAPENVSISRMYAYASMFQLGADHPGSRSGMFTQDKYTAVYPNAFSLIETNDADNTYLNNAVKGIVRGDVMMFRAWASNGTGIGNEFPMLRQAIPLAQAQGWTGAKVTNPVPATEAVGSRSQITKSIPRALRGATANLK